MNEIERLKVENDWLKKNNSAKSDLISVTAHQIRTSLSAIKWTLKMFLDKDLGDISVEQEAFLKKSFESVEIMISVLNDTLTLNNTEDFEAIFKFEKINIVELINQTILEFLGEAKKKGVEIIFNNVDEKIPQINCNKKMMRVVFQNLIENALKYTKTGGDIKISLKNIDNGIEIFIQDSGIGINEKEKESIFQRFYRAENAKEIDKNGSGLGLYTTKKIIEDHKGMISFKSEENAGTTFFVILPLN